MSLPFALAHLAARHDGPLQIVQVGAFDGTTNDPISDALERFDCRAVLVEPQPRPFERLTALHRGNENVRLVNAAIDSRDGTRAMFTINPEGMPEWVGQLASFDRTIVEAHQRFTPQLLRINTTQVPTMTFDTLIADARLDRVDVLQIDAEGYDLELLKLFDVPRRSPHVVNWEHKHLSHADRDAAIDLMVDCGFRVAVSDDVVGDSVAYRLPSSYVPTVDEHS